MADKTVDVAELVKQHQELGDMIEKLGGKIEKKGKKDAAKGKEEYADVDGDEDDMEKRKKEEAEAVAKKAEEQKAAELAKKAELEKSDESIVFKGQTIKKSAVGEVQFGLVKSMSEALEKSAEEIAKNSAEIKKAQDETALAKLEKRADDEFAHVPGTTQERAAMLKSIGEMPDALKKSFEAVFKQSEALAKSAFEMKGTNAGDSDDLKKGRADFEAKVTEIKKRDNCGKTEAMAKARQEHPDLFKVYQGSQN